MKVRFNLCRWRCVLRLFFQVFFDGFHPFEARKCRHAFGQDASAWIELFNALDSYNCASNFFDQIE